MPDPSSDPGHTRRLLIAAFLGLVFFVVWGIVHGQALPPGSTLDPREAVAVSQRAIGGTLGDHALTASDGRAIRTLKQCPPFVDAMAHGFVLLLPCDVQVHDGRFSWHWDLPAPAVPGHPRAPLSFHVPAQLEGSPLHRAGRAAIKFNSFWTIELELQGGGPVVVATTDELTGEYQFRGVPQGIYEVREVLTGDWIPTNPAGGTRVVFPAPVGARSTAHGFAFNAASNSGRTTSIGSG